MSRQANILSFDEAARASHATHAVRGSRTSSRANSMPPSRSSSRASAASQSRISSRAGSPSRSGSSASRNASLRDDYANSGFLYGTKRDVRQMSSSRSDSFARSSMNRSASGPNTSRAYRPTAAPNASRVFGSQSRGSEFAASMRQSNAASMRQSDARSMRSQSSERREQRNNAFAEDEENMRPSFMQKLKKKKHDLRKEKAGKQFSRQFADAPSEASENAPRAALYTGSLGTKQRQAMDMQRGPTDNGRMRRVGAKSSHAQWLTSKKFIALAGVTACLIFACAFTYPTARQYYQTIRHNAQLEAEYEAIQARNGALQKEVDSLQTEAGVSQRAHEIYGWVEEGENSVLVQGLERQAASKSDGYQVAINPNSIPAPQTWYSPVLDKVFGYPNQPQNEDANQSQNEGSEA